MASTARKSRPVTSCFFGLASGVLGRAPRSKAGAENRGTWPRLAGAYLSRAALATALMPRPGRQRPWQSAWGRNYRGSSRCDASPHECGCGYGASEFAARPLRWCKKEGNGRRGVSAEGGEDARRKTGWTERASRPQDKGLPLRTWSCGVRRYARRRAAPPAFQGQKFVDACDYKRRL